MMNNQSIFVSAPKSRITACIDRAPDHLKPILVVRDAGIGFAMIPQHTGAFSIPAEKPAIVIMGDDMQDALGPVAFDPASVRQFISQCHGAVVVSCAPLFEAYAAAAAQAAGLRQNVVIVETQPKQEIPWIHLIREAVPNIALLIATVKGGTA